MSQSGSRYYRCPCCKGRRRIAAGETWTRPHGDGSLRIVSPEKDGAIVEQIERPQDGRWGISYSDLTAGYVRSNAPPEGESE